MLAKIGFPALTALVVAIGLLLFASVKDHGKTQQLLRDEKLSHTVTATEKGALAQDVSLLTATNATLEYSLGQNAQREKEFKHLQQKLNAKELSFKTLLNTLKYEESCEILLRDRPDCLDRLYRQAATIGD